MLGTRRWGIGLFVLLAGCFTDTQPDPQSDGGESGDSGGAGTMSSGPTTVAPDSTADETAGDGSGGSDVDCPAGGPGCDCAEPCQAPLMCVMGMCVGCGDGFVGGQEECDGPVPGGECVNCTIVCGQGVADCDGDPANGCEADLSSPQHCGGCGHDCLGGDCEAAICQPVTVAGGQDEPLWVEVANGTVYWTDHVPSGELRARELTMGAQVIEIASGIPLPRTLAVDATHVYWTVETTAAIGRVELDGTNPEEQWSAAASLSAGTTLVMLPDRLFSLGGNSGVTVVRKSDGQVFGPFGNSARRGVVE
ncbi:MAG: hypothetical protein AAF721_09605, partial [Myxococcota bacterium]